VLQPTSKGAKAAVPDSPAEANVVSPAPREVHGKSVQDSLTAGVNFLLKAQSRDGAWRSDVYATFKDGIALTPLVVGALQDAAAAGVEPPGSAAVRRDGIMFLVKLAKSDGSIEPGPDGIDYPIYTAALTVKILSHADGNDFRAARTAWVKFLKDRQLTAKLGWTEEEKQFGGWGYCRVIPEKPKPNEFAPNLIESNLSATVYALQALKDAGELDDETARTAAVFVRRCQNWTADGQAAAMDGGFHFIYDDPVRNKAGLADLKEGESQPRFNSYGSTTADGLRALALCGDSKDKARKEAAANWLAKNFRADTHPGRYVKPQEPNREAVYYYYAASVSRAMREQGKKLADGSYWNRALATQLMKRQQGDGSWVNAVDLVRENEPLVATSNALTALTWCR
jgi:hypothetical protein